MEKKAVYARYLLAEDVIEGLAGHGRRKAAEVILGVMIKLAEAEETTGHE